MNFAATIEKSFPRRVAICALGPSLVDYVNLAKAAGGRHEIADEVWAINALGGVLQHDRVFHMDDVRIQEARAKENPAIARMLDWMRRHDRPIYTSRSHTAYASLIDYPLEQVINTIGGMAYFNSTVAYAIAFGIAAGVKEMGLYGIDFSHPNHDLAEKGRACVEFWIATAMARGVNIKVAGSSTLLDANVPNDQRLYGYDTEAIEISEREDGSAKVTRTPRETIPTAEEMERRYDHRPRSRRTTERETA